MKILVIEDDAGINELLKERLEAHGCGVVCISTAAEAFDYVADRSPALIILDYSLPDMNGKEFIEELVRRKQTPPPFIVSTGYGNEHIAVEMMKLGARDYIVKDASFLDILPEVVKRVFNEIENENKRKQAEEALRLSEEKYRDLFDNLYNIHYATDDKGMITHISPSIQRNFGYTPDELTGRKITDFYIDPKEREELLTLLVKDGYVNNFEARLRHKDGSTVWLSTDARLKTDEKGNFTGVQGVSRNVTEQKQTESDIQALVESTVGIAGPGFFNGIVEKLCGWLNCEFAILGELEGPSSVHALAMIVENNLIDHTHDVHDSPCDLALRGGFCAYPEGVRELFPEDRGLVEMKAEGYIGVPLVDRDGERIGVLCAASRGKMSIPGRAKDVFHIIAARASAEIERMRLEKRRKNLEIQLEQARKMEAIGTLAGGIAHDFNNILFPILGYAQMLMEDAHRNGPLKEGLVEILKAAERARDLVKQILTFSRMESGESSPMKIQAIVKEALKLIRSTIPATIEICQDLQADCGEIMADPTQIHQIIMNLATNARHAMEAEGGRLEVSLKQVELGKSDQDPPGLAPGDYALLTVADQGVGMDEDVLEKIFDPFFTTKENGRGTGMGLSVVHGIVEKLEGGVRARSEPGKGAEFRLYFPINGNSFETRETEYEEPTPRGSERILLVDDEEMIVAVEKQMLERMGRQVVAHTSSMEALEEFRADPDKFDLVITDMAMPEMSGDKLAAELLAIRPGTPILLCTGYSETITEDELASLGVDALILKPILKEDLARSIRDVLGRKKE